MKQPPTYCIDTSSLLEARSRTYPPHIFPSLWINIERLIEQRRLFAPEEVLTELLKKDDDAAAWAKGQPNLFVSIDLEQTVEVSSILSVFPLLVDSSKNRSAGDPWVIALAKIHQHIVITEEKLSGSPKRPKIPDVCKHYAIEYISVLDLIRREQWTF